MFVYQVPLRCRCDTCWGIRVTNRRENNTTFRRTEQHKRAENMRTLVGVLLLVLCLLGRETSARGRNCGIIYCMLTLLFWLLQQSSLVMAIISIVYMWCWLSGYFKSSSKHWRIDCRIKVFSGQRREWWLSLSQNIRSMFCISQWYWPNVTSPLGKCWAHPTKNLAIKIIVTFSLFHQKSKDKSQLFWWKW